MSNVVLLGKASWTKENFVAKMFIDQDVPYAHWKPGWLWRYLGRILIVEWRNFRCASGEHQVAICVVTIIEQYPGDIFLATDRSKTVHQRHTDQVCESQTDTNCFGFVLRLVRTVFRNFTPQTFLFLQIQLGRPINFNHLPCICFEQQKLSTVAVQSQRLNFLRHEDSSVEQNTECHSTTKTRPGCAWDFSWSAGKCWRSVAFHKHFTKLRVYPPSSNKRVQFDSCHALSWYHWGKKFQAEIILPQSLVMFLLSKENGCRKSEQIRGVQKEIWSSGCWSTDWSYWFDQ